MPLAPRSLPDSLPQATGLPAVVSHTPHSCVRPCATNERWLLWCIVAQATWLPTAVYGKLHGFAAQTHCLQAPPTNFFRPVSLGGGLYVAGDHRDSATLNGALVSGRRAVESLLQGVGVKQ